MSSAHAVGEGVLPLTRIPVAELAPNVVVVGDPGRARAVGERLEEARELASNREYVSIGGTYRGVPVTVVSHGGTVHLRGVVPSDDQKRSLETTVKAVDGVQRIENQITVEHG